MQGSVLGFVALAAALVLSTPTRSQPPPAPLGAAAPNPDVAQASAKETAKPSRGQVTVNGRQIAYVATPGTLTIRNDEGEPTASMFYVAYTVEPTKGAPPRPVSFIFNGGPGSSTMWLHMGSFGPLRIDTPGLEAPAPGSVRPGPNPESIIDKTDLVFLDAIGTGFSRPLGAAKMADFLSVDKDIDVFARGIARYVAKNDRWMSPKFIIGESYGSMRAAGLAYTLQQRGLTLNGVVMISSILNFEFGADRGYLNTLPTFAAIAWYHDRVPNKPASLSAYVDEVRAFVQGPYLAALAKGDDLAPAERDAIARRAAGYTGVSPQVMINNNLRMSSELFRKELMRDEGKALGRLDARFVGTEFETGADGPTYDPTDAALSGAYVAAANHYLLETLGYQTELTYRPNFYSGVRGFDWQHTAPGGGGPGPVNTAVDLGQAMRQNPRLKVLSMNGYYDLATPFHATEYALKHMNLAPALRPNLVSTYYAAGHMTYIEPESRLAMKRDFDRFYDAALER